MLKSDVHKPGTIQEIVIAKVPKDNTFLYFSYGSNILTFRMHMSLPNAEFVAVARLDDYRLDFMGYDSFWGGPTATIVPTANAHVWGVIWRLNRDDCETLDEHIGVTKHKYYVRYVTVLTRYMGYFKCRSYEQRVNPSPRGNKDQFSIEQRPSRSLRRVMILGAYEHEFPPHYIEYLKKLQHNGDMGAFELECLLRRYCGKELCTCRVPGVIPRIPLKLNLKKRASKLIKITKQF